MAEQTDNNDHWPEDDTGHESPSPGEGRSFFSTWGWPLFGLAAFVIFELTTSLMWSSLVFALRFGWKDSYAGCCFWWWENSHARGWASGLLCLSSATSKVFVAGFVMMLGLILLLGPPGRNQMQQVDKAMMVIAMLFLAGMLASGIFGVMAVTVCRFSGQKLWIDRSSYQQAIDRDWPPRRFTANRVPTICFFLMIPLTGLFLVLTLFFPLVFFGDPLNRNAPLWIAVAPLLLSPFVSILFFFYGIHWLKRTVVAKTPSECWPELVNSDEIDESDL